jgi:hypothetical protein
MIRRNSLSPVLDASWLVRYRFESPAHLARHLRLGDGFFIPGRTLRCAPGSRVMVEIAFLTSDERPLLHGRVRWRRREGVCLDAPAALAMARWAPEPGAPCRRHRRIASDLFAEMRPRGALSYLCRALDLSMAGLRLGTGTLEAGVIGDHVELTLLSPQTSVSAVDLRARLVWAGAREAGLAVLSAPPELSAVIGLVEDCWKEVDELIHGDSCPCQGVVERATGHLHPYRRE